MILHSWCVCGGVRNAVKPLVGVRDVVARLVGRRDLVVRLVGASELFAWLERDHVAGGARNVATRLVGGGA